MFIFIFAELNYDLPVAMLDSDGAGFGILLVAAPLGRFVTSLGFFVRSKSCWHLG